MVTSGRNNWPDAMSDMANYIGNVCSIANQYLHENHNNNIIMSYV